MTAVVRDSKAMLAVARSMTEAELQRSVLDLSTLLGLLVFHSGDSRRDSCAGYPDLTIVGSRGVMWRELKTQGGRVRVEQQRWLSRLSRSGHNAAVWRPVDWLNDTVAAELKAIR